MHTSSSTQNNPLIHSQWITQSYKNVKGKQGVPVFRKTFEINPLSPYGGPLKEGERKIKQAILYITALGLYESQINGQRIGKAYFTPGFTSYNKRLQYQEYDVTNMLKASNEIRVMVGEGWYRGVFRAGASDKSRNNYGSEAGLIAQLVIRYVDGTSQRIVTDTTWQCAESGIRYSELYDGEMQDTRYLVRDWKPVKLLEPSKAVLVPSISEPVRKQESFRALRTLITPKGEQVVDFGQNLAGWVQLKVKGKAGDTVRITHAEVLDKDGNFYTGNLRSAKAEDIYILNGKQQVLEPHFTYHGFRYIKVQGMNVKDGQFRAIALYSDMKRTGSFACSDPMIGKLQSNIEWSMKSNFVDIPTDCPQRSERLGWTGDAQVFAPTASFLFDTRLFYKKWLADLAAEQGSNGAVPNYVPTVAPGVEVTSGVAGWGDAATVIPWTVYQAYRDTAVLRDQYGSMKGWVDYVASKSVGGLWKANGYGDWYAPGPKTDLALIDQCYWAHSATILIDAARVLGKTADVDFYTAMLAGVKQKFAEHYMLGSGRLSSDTQTAYVLALAFDLVPQGQRAALVARLVALIQENNNHLATGFLGTPELLRVLSENGYSKLSYSLLLQKTYPSWLFPITMGATTIWEKWDGMDADGTAKPTSYNHYSYGAVGRWLYENVVGIKAASPGYREITIKPEIGGGLSWAKGSYLCEFGKIVSEWKVYKGKVTLMVEIPRGTTAEVFLPGDPIAKRISAGKYRFVGNIK